MLRQRGLAARDSKARRGELRFCLPPGYCWNELERIEIDPDERVADSVRLVFRKVRELGSVRQVLLCFKEKSLAVPVVRHGARGSEIAWKPAAYHNVLEVLRSPIYTGAYVFGRTAVGSGAAPVGVAGISPHCAVGGGTRRSAVATSTYSQIRRRDPIRENHKTICCRQRSAPMRLSSLLLSCKSSRGVGSEEVDA